MGEQVIKCIYVCVLFSLRGGGWWMGGTSMERMRPITPPLGMSRSYQSQGVESSRVEGGGTEGGR